ncbi:TetR family transcriptional regulator [Allosalinactinospora lopnorensis]|uniref:TetR family transcriptional regulator n=1 Tax=Allosalinactinospora lopnorensis TaxID=1352348 RepID=UPI000623DCD0|nr:TetR family transcriptional regulator [Allosalinactinospora lopnorensis]
MSDDWRERKKARTRRAIQEAALRLFLDKGYEETTVAQIAQAAGVSHMTFFRYFPTKEDVVIEDEYDPMIEELIRSRPADEPPAARVRHAVTQELALIGAADREVVLTRLRLMLSTPALRARLWENQYRTQRLLERALSGEDDPAPVPLRTRVIASACLAALVTALTTWAESDGADDLPALVDEAFAVLRGEFD